MLGIITLIITTNIGYIDNFWDFIDSLDGTKVSKLSGTITVPADKSITHRAIMFASLADGTSYINNYLPSQDCFSTLNIFKQLGVDIEQTDNKLIIKGAGIYGLKQPNITLNANNVFRIRFVIPKNYSNFAVIIVCHYYLFNGNSRSLHKFHPISS